MAGKWFIEKFLVHGLIAAISLPMTVLSVSSLIDAQWNVVSTTSRTYTPCRNILEAVACKLLRQMHLDSQVDRLVDIQTSFVMKRPCDIRGRSRNRSSRSNTSKFSHLGVQQRPGKLMVCR